MFLFIYTSSILLLLKCKIGLRTVLVPDPSVCVWGGGHRGHMPPPPKYEAATNYILPLRNKQKHQLHVENRCTNSKFLPIKVS